MVKDHLVDDRIVCIADIKRKTERVKRVRAIEHDGLITCACELEHHWVTNCFGYTRNSLHFVPCFLQQFIGKAESLKRQQSLEFASAGVTVPRQLGIGTLVKLLPIKCMCRPGRRGR